MFTNTKQAINRFSFGFGERGIDKELGRDYTLVLSWNLFVGEIEVEEANIARSRAKEARRESNNDV
jgi:hypothetical protein